jgi:hypothetical protein
MKQTKAIAFTVMVTLLSFGAVIYSSCRRDRCKTLNCQNGGTCNDGFCYCPSGFTGTYCQTANVSTIVFKNKTFTRVSLIINGSDYSVDTGTFITFTGSYGDTLKGNAKTHGAYGLNVDLDAFKLVFPVHGSLVYDLNVNPNFFFLKATNNNPTVPYITQVYVNYKDPDSTLDITSIYNDGKPYFIGYYKATDSTAVRLEKTPDYWPFNSLSLPMTINQSFNAVVN